MKFLDRLPEKHFRQLDQKISSLEHNPRPQDCAKLTGLDDAYRVTQGEYRILYAIDDRVRVVSITKIDHRDSVYRPRRNKGR